MKTLLQTIKIPVEVLKVLRLIAAHTGETQYAVIARLLRAELTTIQHSQDDPTLRYFPR